MTHQDDKQPESFPRTTNRYIRCPDCGEQILMMPSLSEMIEAIENHLSTHGTQAKLNPIVHHLKEPVIEESLAKQVLLTAADIKLTSTRNITEINLE
jgi:hypothetical protein